MTTADQLTEHETHSNPARAFMGYIADRLATGSPAPTVESEINGILSAANQIRVANSISLALVPSETGPYWLVEFSNITDDGDEVPVYGISLQEGQFEEAMGDGQYAPASDGPAIALSLIRELEKHEASDQLQWGPVKTGATET